jgi:hypothetical protein
MRIKKVRVSGFQKLFEGCSAAAKENRVSFGSGLFPFLEHCMIAIEATGLTSMEVFYLRRLSSDMHVIDSEYGNFIPEKKIDVNQKVGELLKLHNEILNDDDINKEETCIENILPIGCSLHHVIVIFKGSYITSITGALIQDIFIDQEEKKIFEIYPGDLIMENILAEKFYNSLYTYMSNQITDIDVVTEFITTKKFYQYADSICNLAHVNTPFGDLEFFGNSQEKLQNQIKRIQDSMNTSPYIYTDMTYFTFVMKTTFNTFMKFILYTNYVVDYENLKLVFLKDGIDVGEDIISKYDNRINTSLEYIASYKKELSESTAIDLNKFNFIYNGTEIVYSIQIPLSKIEQYRKNEETSFDELMAIINSMNTTVDTIKNLLGF